MPSQKVDTGVRCFKCKARKFSEKDKALFWNHSNTRPGWTTKPVLYSFEFLPVFSIPEEWKACASRAIIVQQLHSSPCLQMTFLCSFLPSLNLHQRKAYGYFGNLAECIFARLQATDFLQSLYEELYIFFSVFWKHQSMVWVPGEIPGFFKPFHREGELTVTL